MTRHKSPPRWLWAVWIVALIVLVALRTVIDLGDSGFTNLATFVVVALSVVVGGAWFVLHSGHSARLRWGSAAAVVVVLVALPLVVEQRGMSGTMLPILGLRGTGSSGAWLGSVGLGGIARHRSAVEYHVRLHRVPRQRPQSAGRQRASGARLAGSASRTAVEATHRHRPWRLRCRQRLRRHPRRARGRRAGDVVRRCDWRAVVGHRDRRGVRAHDGCGPAEHAADPPRCCLRDGCPGTPGCPQRRNRRAHVGPRHFCATTASASSKRTPTFSTVGPRRR